MRRRKKKSNPATWPLVGGIVLGGITPVVPGVLLADVLSPQNNARASVAFNALQVAAGLVYGKPGTMLRGMAYGSVLNLLLFGAFGGVQQALGQGGGVAAPLARQMKVGDQVKVPVASLVLEASSPFALDRSGIDVVRVTRIAQDFSLIFGTVVSNSETGNDRAGAFVSFPPSALVSS